MVTPNDFGFEDFPMHSLYKIVRIDFVEMAGGGDKDYAVATIWFIDLVFRCVDA